MLKTIEIQHFKSIEHLTIDCGKLNVFIGEPNTGKSNILEAIGLFSLPYCKHLNQIARLENMSDLFFEKKTDKPIEIKTDTSTCSVFFQEGKVELDVNYSEKGNIKYVTGEDAKKWRGTKNRSHTPFKFYKYTTLDRYILSGSPFLLPPYGENLLNMLKDHDELRETCAAIFQPLGYKLWLRPHEGKIDIVQNQNEISTAMEVVISHPYKLISDTFQRLMFYLAAIETNNQSVLIFEEPEVRSFPFYSKFLAERITLDQNNNQYFLSTHNPYFLLSLVEKSKIDDIRIFITYTDSYKTRIRKLKSSELSEIIEHGIDVFFNILRYIEDNE